MQPRARPFACLATCAALAALEAGAQDSTTVINVWMMPVEVQWTEVPQGVPQVACLDPGKSRTFRHQHGPRSAVVATLHEGGCRRGPLQCSERMVVEGRSEVTSNLQCQLALLVSAARLEDMHIIELRNKGGEPVLVQFQDQRRGKVPSSMEVAPGREQVAILYRAASYLLRAAGCAEPHAVGPTRTRTTRAIELTKRGGECRWQDRPVGE